MSIWLWIIVGVVAVILLIVLLGLIGWLVAWFKGRQEERKLAQDPDFIRRLGQEKNADQLVKLLENAWSHKIRARAAEVLAQLRDPSTIAALLRSGFETLNTAETRTACAQALGAMPGEQVVPLVLAKLGGGKDDLAIEVLRHFDLPAAREVVVKFDKERNEALAKIARQRDIVKGLLADAAQKARTTVTLPLPIQLGGGTVAGKIIGGMLTGGVMAVTPNKFTLDGFVKLPEECVLCSCLPGKHERLARCSFRFASAGWSLTGVNTAGEAYLTYKVCTECSAPDEKARAVLISVDRDEQKTWYVRLNVLNPEIARQVQELNAGAPGG